jgi:ribosomal protein L11 methyltransferase
MAAPKILWSASFAVAPEAADILSGAMGDEALALTVMSPPRAHKADVEAIFDAPPDPAALQMRLAILAVLNGVATPQLTIKALPKLDWLKKVAEDFPPLPIGRWIVYGAQHRRIAALNHRIGLQIDATSAFGTGEHPTTRGCLMLLDGLLKRGFKPGSMLDMGCGSGILAMACAKACHRRAAGVDLDQDSVEIAKNNIRANGLRDYVRIARGNGYHTPLARHEAPYDLIMANIFAGPLCRMAYDLKRHLCPGGMAILSGLLTPQANRVIAAHRMQGLRLVRHMRVGEWSVLAFRRLSRVAVQELAGRAPKRQ